MATRDERPPAFPSQIFETLTAYRRTAALRGAIDLDLFTVVATGAETAAAIAGRCGASVRGVRILCDCLVALDFLRKDGDRYALRPVAARYLDRRSPDYVGALTGFLNAPAIAAGFDDVAAAVRRGGTTLAGEGTVAPAHPIWVDFARAMAPMARLTAEALADALALDETRPVRVLDVAAGHGHFGLALARRYPGVAVVALDWPAVLEVAGENARAAGLAARFRALPGDALTTAFGGGHDLVLLANFLHHFDPATCEGLLRKAHAALAPGGRVVIVDFVPDEDRVAPAVAATFALVMLALTPAGDVYTFAEYARMGVAAGFARSTLLALPPSPQRAIVAER